MFNTALKSYVDELEQCSEERIEQYSRQTRIYHALNILATGATTAYFWHIGAVGPFHYTSLVLALLLLRAASLVASIGRSKLAIPLLSDTSRQIYKILLASIYVLSAAFIFFGFHLINSPAMINVALVSGLFFMRGVTVLFDKKQSSNLLSSHEFLKSGIVYNFSLCFYIGIGTAIFAQQLNTPAAIVLVLWCLLNALGSGIVSSSITRLAGHLTLVSTLPFVITFLIDFHLENNIIAVLVLLLSVLTFAFVHDHRKSFQEIEKQREKEETAKQKAQTMLQSFMSVATDWAWEIDAELKFTYLSPNFEKINGVPKETVLGVPALAAIDEAVMPDSRTEMEYIKTRLRTGKGVDDISLHVQLGSGEEAWIQMHAHVILTETGDFDGFRGWMSDVSALARANKETENANQMLEQKVRQRTTELEKKTEEHKKARDEAQEANTVKTKFLANMSHEIRTPMNGIVGLCELLGRDEMNDKQRDYIETIHSSATALMRIINEILDMSKLSAAKMQLEKTDTDVNALLEQVISVLKHTADEKGLILKTAISTSLKPMIIDEGRVRQILINLIGNAIKFTSEGEINVEIKSTVIGNYQKILVKVKDTGVGIASNKISLVFEDFAQVSEGTTKYHQGTGLGLSICKKLVTLMGGKIGVRSKENIGSTFWFQITDDIALTPPSGAALESSPPFIKITDENEKPSSSIPLKILIAEDNAVNVMVLATFLQEITDDILISENGVEAHKAFVESPPDIIFMDVSMPEMDGREATRVIRIHEEANSLNRTPIIGCTAHADPEEQNACLEAGMDLVITKPIDSTKIKAALTDAQSRANSHVA